LIDGFRRKYILNIITNRMISNADDTIIDINKIYNMDCLAGLSMLPDKSVDLTITSPPYDNLRTYNNTLEWGEHIWKPVINELYRITKRGGVVVWVVADATINGSETGTSFRQALYFKDVGFNIHDTMIYRKNSYVPLSHNRYEQEFEYMYVFSKGKPKSFNPIRIPCKYAGEKMSRTYHKTNSSGLISVGKKEVKDTKIHGNIFTYKPSCVRATKGHPAPFPEQLVIDHITTWSNEGEVVLDPFMGSGTTAVACINTNRKYIGFEINTEYCKIAEQRLGEIHNGN
jgi:DNA modification methylase